jgi:hypothetical protein
MPCADEGCEEGTGGGSRGGRISDSTSIKGLLGAERCTIRNRSTSSHIRCGLEARQVVVPVRSC